MAFLAALGVAVLLIRIGFALYAAGLVRAKNSAGTVIRTIADLCISVLAFWAVGAAILLQTDNKWISVDTEFLFGPHGGLAIGTLPALFFYVAIMLTATSVVGGAVAERCRFFPLCAASLVLAALVFPVAGNWAWFGWLKRIGFVDVAGAALHVSAGVFAAVAAVFVGPRVGKFNKDGSSAMIPGHSLPLTSIGTLVLLVGWIVYVAGAAIVWIDPQAQQFLLRLPEHLWPEMADLKFAMGAMNVLLCAAAAGLVSIFVSQIRYGKPDIGLTLTALLGGLVAICASSYEVPTWAAVVIGAVAGVIVPMAAAAIDLRLRLDDPLGVIAIHAIGGAWGMLAAGIFIPVALAPAGIRPRGVPQPTDLHIRFSQIVIQLIGLASIALFAAVVATIVFFALKATLGLRARDADEFDGLDLAEHDIGAYPDFQQNSIKSYHLRET